MKFLIMVHELSQELKTWHFHSRLMIGEFYGELLRFCFALVAFYSGTPTLLQDGYSSRCFQLSLFSCAFFCFKLNPSIMIGNFGSIKLILGSQRFLRRVIWQAVYFLRCPHQNIYYMITVYIVGQGIVVLPLKKSLILHVEHVVKKTDCRKINFVFTNDLT